MTIYVWRDIAMILGVVAIARLAFFMDSQPPQQTVENEQEATVERVRHSAQWESVYDSEDWDAR